MTGPRLVTTTNDVNAARGVLLEMEDDLRSIPEMLQAIWLIADGASDRGLDAIDCRALGRVALVTKRLAKNVEAEWDRALEKMGGEP